MKSKWTFLSSLLAAVLLALAVGPGQAQGPQPLPLSGQGGGLTAVGITIPYAGRLDDAAGQPVPDGAYNFTFTLYGAETGGAPLWSETQEGVTVQGGAFVALLGSVNGLPKEVLDGGKRWLEVAVQGLDEANFTTLAPRQRLSVSSPAAPISPAAGAACPHDHWGETWEGSSGSLYLNNTASGNQVWLPGPLSGIMASGTAWGGVYGKSDNNIGVLGESVNYYGGVFQSNQDQLDMYLGGNVGRLNSDPSNEHSQLYLSSNADVIVKLDNDGGEDHAFRIKNSGGSDVFAVNEAGDMWAAGLKSALVKTAHHGRRLLYAVESPEVWFEDLGTVVLVDGEATVAFDPVFAETVNLEEAYHVFVTPLCQEPVLLFVTAKSAAGFTVRGVTLDGEPSQCGFDYRVVARRLGYEDIRLEAAEWQEGE